jgi:hypothetical protein
VKLSELVRLLESNGFSLVKEKGSIRYYGAQVPGDLDMLDLPCSLVFEATDEPDCFGFFSPELTGFSGIGHSVEDCLYKTSWGMKEHVPPANPAPTVTIQNEQRRSIA